MARINTNKMMSPVEKCRQQIKSAYGAIIAVLAFSLLNIVLLISNAGIEFLFSGFIPTMITSVGYVLGGTFDEEGYLLTMNYLPLLISAIIAAVTLIPYLVSILIYKKHTHGAILTSLITFALDTVILLFYFDIGFLLNIIFHGIVLYSLIVGFIAHPKLAKLEAEAAAQAEAEAAEIKAAEEKAQLEQTASVAEENAPAEEAAETTEESNDI